jgi:hypothetical protein
MNSSVTPKNHSQPEHDEDLLDHALDESFPASDPPAPDVADSKAEQQQEEALDDALDDSFPASDPPAATQPS